MAKHEIVSNGNEYFNKLRLIIDTQNKVSVGRVHKYGIIWREERPEEVRDNFKKLFGRPPEKVVFDGGDYERIKTGKGKGEIIEWKREYVMSEDTVIVSFPREGKPDDAKSLTQKVVVYNKGDDFGQQVVEEAEPTCIQILELRKKYGDPNSLYWLRKEVRAVDDYGSEENIFERGILYNKEIELDVLEKAQEVDSKKYREEYLVRKMEKKSKQEQKYV